MNRIVLPVAAISLAAFGIGSLAPPARASAEGRRNTAILLGIVAAIAADEYADKRAEEACRSSCGRYYEYERRGRPCSPPHASRWRHGKCPPGHLRRAEVVVRVERHEHCYCDTRCDCGARVRTRRGDDGPAYWREPWAR
jgi:hypothetical protein